MGQKKAVATIKPEALNTSTKFSKKTKQELITKDWYVEYYCPYTNERVRDKGGINRIKDFDSRYEQIKILQAATQLILDEGNTTRKIGNSKAGSLKEATDMWLETKTKEGIRKKTRQGYTTKIKHLLSYFDKDSAVKDITRVNAKDCLTHLSDEFAWHNTTYNNTLTTFKSIFKYLVSDRELLNSNPFDGIKRKTKIRTNKHRTFTDNDYQIIKKECANNESLYVFCSMLFYTCIRPGELREIKLKDINFEQNTIQLYSEFTKTKQNDIVIIEPALREILLNINADKMPREWYLFSKEQTIAGAKQVGVNYFYEAFIKVLDRLGLQGKEYTLYSWKHFSNVTRYKAGATLLELMQLNRHTTQTMTEIYLKDILHSVGSSYTNRREAPTLM